jgi:hypothetical protein
VAAADEREEDCESEPEEAPLRKPSVCHHEQDPPSAKIKNETPKNCSASARTVLFSSDRRQAPQHEISLSRKVNFCKKRRVFHMELTAWPKCRGIADSAVCNAFLGVCKLFV